MIKSILVLGLGNPLQGDDGVGCRIAEALARQTLPEDVEVMDGGTPGWQLLNLVEGRRRVIIVDAAEMGERPGTIKAFSPEALNGIPSAPRFSLHRADVAQVLELARGLKFLLPEILFLGVQPGRVAWGSGLSAPVLKAVPQALATILNAVSSNPATVPSRPSERAAGKHGRKEGADHGQ